jgi:hypothetical protein
MLRSRQNLITNSTVLGLPWSVAGRKTDKKSLLLWKLKTHHHDFIKAVKTSPILMVKAVGSFTTFAQTARHHIPEDRNLTNSLQCLLKAALSWTSSVRFTFHSPFLKNKFDDTYARMAMHQIPTAAGTFFFFKEELWNLYKYFLHVSYVSLWREDMYKLLHKTSKAFAQIRAPTAMQ